MALTKVNYVDGVTTIMAKNLNDIQNEVIANGAAITTQATQISGKADAAALADETTAREAADTAEATARAAADTTLTNELDDVKSALFDIQVGKITIKLESGTFADADGVTKQPRAARIRTAEPVPVATFDTITIPSEFDVWIFKLDANKTLIGTYSTSWTANFITSSMFESDVHYINIVFRKIDSTSSDISGYVDTLENSLDTSWKLSATIKKELPVLKQLNESLLLKKIQPTLTADDYGVKSTGLAYANADRRIVKYRVTHGQQVYIRACADGDDDAVYLFQESPGVSTSASTAIGPVVTTDTDAIVTVPRGAYWIIMSVLKTNTLNGLYEYGAPEYWLPDYWETYLDNTIIPNLTNKDLMIGNHGDSFVFFTDLHNNYRYGNIIDKIYHNTNAKMLVCGGDVIEGSADKAENIELLRKYIKSVPSKTPLTIRGNHDGNSQLSSSTPANEITAPEFYALCLKPVENEIVSDGNLYYYKDNVNQKIRYIFLDTGAPQSTVISDVQIEWMKSRITELSSDWTAVIFAHAYYNSVNNIHQSGTRIESALDEIYGTGATIACVISGHTHKDQSYVSVKGYPIIITTGAFVFQESQTQGTPLNRTIGTVTETAFDVFHIDTENRTIYVTRVGAGEDRTFTY